MPSLPQRFPLEGDIATHLSEPLRTRKNLQAFKYVGFMDGNDYFGVVSGTRTIKGMKNFPRNMPPIMSLSTLPPFDSC
jgi:hypothetical protein